MFRHTQNSGPTLGLWTVGVVCISMYLLLVFGALATPLQLPVREIQPTVAITIEAAEIVQPLITAESTTASVAAAVVL